MSRPTTDPPKGWKPVAWAANHMGCDFCEEDPAGWVMVVTPNRSLGGWKERYIFLVCVEHMKLGLPVHPAEEREDA